MATQQRGRPQGGQGHQDQRQHAQGGQRTQAAPPPVEKFRAGRLEAAVWRHDGEQGPWYSVTFKRTYTDAQGNPQSADSFGLDDLLAVAELARLAWAWVHKQRARDKAAAEGQHGSNGNGHHGTNGRPQPDQQHGDANEDIPF